MPPGPSGTVPRRGTWPLVQATLVGLYLEAMFSLQARNWPGYSYIQFLFDYAHGPARRSLEGEIARHLVAPPYSIGQFQTFASAQFLVAMLLLVLVVWRSGTPTFTLPRTVLVALLAASPLTFKNLLLDQGRQDVLGVIVLLVALLLGWARVPALLAGFLAVVAVPLGLANENLLLLYFPAALVILGGLTLPGHSGRPRRIGCFAVALGAGAAACLVCMLLPQPKIPPAAYRTYLASKSVTRLPPWDPERWLYSSAHDSFTFARGEWSKYLHAQETRLPQYLLFFCMLVGGCFLTARSLPARSRGRGWYLAGLGCVLPGYGLLMLGASDVARWFANFNLCLLSLSLWFLVDADAEARPGREWWALVPAALFGVLFLGGFGINEPAVDLGAGFRWLAPLFGGA